MIILFEVLAAVSFGLSVFNFIKAGSRKNALQGTTSVIPQVPEKAGGHTRVVSRSYLIERKNGG